VLFSLQEIPGEVKSSSDGNNLPVIVSVTGGYMEPAASLEKSYENGIEDPHYCVKQEPPDYDDNNDVVHCLPMVRF